LTINTLDPDLLKMLDPNPDPQTTLILKYGKGNVPYTLVRIRFRSRGKLIVNMYLKNNAVITSLPGAATSAIAGLPVILANYTQRRPTDLSLGTRETRQHVAVRSLAEEFPLPGRRIPQQDGHPLPDRVEGEHVQHLQLNLNK
jgi:hypothetical protein